MLTKIDVLVNIPGALWDEESATERDKREVNEPKADVLCYSDEDTEYVPILRKDSNESFDAKEYEYTRYRKRRSGLFPTPANLHHRAPVPTFSNVATTGTLSSIMSSVATTDDIIQIIVT